MKLWHFSEQAYHPAFQVPGNMRVTLPQHHLDPVEAGQLLNRYLDEYMLVDELGMNIMVNEHHSAATCMATSCLTTLSVLARQTQQARLLALGIPLAHRSNPLRVAEEASLVDCLSGGRLEMGLVKGASYEFFMSNRQPTNFMDRFWEAHDLILAAMANEGDNFSWEGEHFHYRTASLWPRPIQQPTPPIWMTASSANSASEYAKLGYVCATFLCGAVARSVFEGYRQTYLKTFGRPADRDRLGYLCLVACANDRSEAFRRAELMKSYFVTAGRLEPQFRSPLGFNPVEANVKMIASGGGGGFRPRMSNGKPLPLDASIEEFMDARLFFVGTPDDICDQLTAFHDEVGGFGNLLMMAQAGDLGHEDTVDNLKLIGREVAPRVAELPEVDLDVRFETVG